jgi:hypothetical protein
MTHIMVALESYATQSKLAATAGYYRQAATERTRRCIADVGLLMQSVALEGDQSVFSASRIMPRPQAVQAKVHIRAATTTAASRSKAIIWTTSRYHHVNTFADG